MQPVIPIIILALPLAMFLFLGLCGHKMSHRLAGIFGTAGMGVTMVLAYITAFTYFLLGKPRVCRRRKPCAPAGCDFQSGLAFVHR